MNIDERIKKLPLRTHIVSVEKDSAEKCGLYLRSIAQLGWPVVISGTGAAIFHVSENDLPAPPEGVEVKTEENS